MTKEQLKVGMRIKYNDLIGTVKRVGETSFATLWDGRQYENTDTFSFLLNCFPYIPDDMS